MLAVHSARAAFAALAGVSGVSRANVTLGHAELQHDAALDLDAVTAALHDVGIDVLEVTTDRRRLGVRD